MPLVLGLEGEAPQGSEKVDAGAQGSGTGCPWDVGAEPDDHGSVGVAVVGPTEVPPGKKTNHARDGIREQPVRQ